MLANLDNEVYFKKVFTDVDVFTAFVKDVLGLDIHINKVETEKVLPSKVSAIKFKMDLFAEDEASRTVIEIQKVDYDYTYDRFAHYFIGNLIDMQRSSKDYAFAKDVYIIVVVTSAYRISDKSGKPIKDDVLVTDINPRTLKGDVRDMHNHKMLIVNTTYVDKDTPQNIMDWANLIIQSMKNPENPQINRQKPAIVRAAKLADVNNLSPQQLADAKIHEMRKATMAILEDEAMTRGEEKGKAKGKAEGKQKEKENGVRKALIRGKLTKEEIAEDFEVSIEYINQIENEMKNI
jgi:hypothetical protein